MTLETWLAGLELLIFGVIQKFGVAEAIWALRPEHPGCARLLADRRGAERQPLQFLPVRSILPGTAAWR